MMALPKAMSHGSNAGGGGALMAFRDISAANAGADTIASAVANNTIFFMTIPITFKDQSDSGAPRDKRQPTAAKFLQPDCNLQRTTPIGEAKKTRICRLFGRSRPGWKCSQRVLHSDNNFERFSCAVRRNAAEMRAFRSSKRRTLREPNHLNSATRGITVLRRFGKKAAAGSAAASIVQPKNSANVLLAVNGRCRLRRRWPVPPNFPPNAPTTVPHLARPNSARLRERSPAQQS